MLQTLENIGCTLVGILYTVILYIILLKWPAFVIDCNHACNAFRGVALYKMLCVPIQSIKPGGNN